MRLEVRGIAELAAGARADNDLVDDGEQRRCLFFLLFPCALAPGPVAVRGSSAALRLVLPLPLLPACPELLLELGPEGLHEVPVALQRAPPSQGPAISVGKQRHALRVPPAQRPSSRRVGVEQVRVPLGGLLDPGGERDRRVVSHVPSAGVEGKDDLEAQAGVADRRGESAVPLEVVVFGGAFDGAPPDVDGDAVRARGGDLAEGAGEPGGDCSCGGRCVASAAVAVFADAAGRGRGRRIGSRPVAEPPFSVNGIQGKHDINGDPTGLAWRKRRGRGGHRRRRRRRRRRRCHRSRRGRCSELLNLNHCRRCFAAAVAVVDVVRRLSLDSLSQEKLSTTTAAAAVVGA